MGFSDRKLGYVSVTAMQLDHGGDLSGRVTLHLSSAGGTEFGPKVSVKMAVSIDAAVSVQAAERALLAGARDLLDRLLEFSPEEWRERMKDFQENQS